MKRWLWLVLCWSGTAYADADDGLYTCKELPANAQISAEFQPDTSIKDLVTWVMGFSCKNVVIATDAIHHASKLTVVAPKKLTPKQAMQLFVTTAEAAGLVVTQKPDTLIVKLGPKVPRSCPHVAVAPTPDVEAPPPPWSDRLVKALETVRKIDDVTYELPRATAKLLLEDPTALKGARPVPAMKDGKHEGFKLFGIRPSSPFAKLGFTNGDTVMTVQGTQVTYDPADASKSTFDAMVKKLAAGLVDLKSPLAQITVTIVRRGKPVTLTFKVK
jgi:hypothetical protein